MAIYPFFGGKVYLCWWEVSYGFGVDEFGQTIISIMSQTSAPSLLDDSLLYEVLVPPSQDFESQRFPRPTQEIIHDAKAVKARKDYLSVLQRRISMGETQWFNLHFELLWQVKVIDFSSSYAELLLTKDEVLDMGNQLKLNWIGEDGIMLKGFRGGKSKRKTQVTKSDKRQNVIRKAFKVRGVRMEFHVGRIYLLNKGIYPTDVGQHVSHTCECWACFEHTLWEYDFVNTKIRKCHDKGEDCCKCGLTPKCIFPPPHPLWTCQPCDTSPPRKKAKPTTD